MSKYSDGQKVKQASINVRLKSLSKHFGNVVAVDNIDLDINNGEFLTFLGPSGSGKTTTLLVIAGFETPTSGEVFMGEKNILNTPPSKRNIGMVFQSYALFPHMTVFENVAFPLKMRKWNKNEISRKTDKALELVQLQELGTRYPRQLSGGQQQRVALARAMVYDPPLLLMDEPLGALDKKLREYMQIEIKNLQKQLGITTIYVTHDQQEALTMSDRIAVYNQGRVEQVGTPDEIYDKPINQFVADFIGESNFISGKVTRTDDKPLGLALDDKTVIQMPDTSGLELGQEIHISIRPEKVKFAENLESLDVILQGIIDEIVYLGEIMKYRIRISNGVSVHLKQQLSHGTKIYKKGGEVIIGWNLQDARFL